MMKQNCLWFIIVSFFQGTFSDEFCCEIAGKHQEWGFPQTCSHYASFFGENIIFLVFKYANNVPDCTLHTLQFFSWINPNVPDD